MGRRMANGERPDRRQWREEGGKRVAAVGERRRCASTEDIRRAPQQGIPTGIEDRKKCGGRTKEGGRVAERSESFNPMIASGNHTDSNNDRPFHCV